MRKVDVDDYVLASKWSDGDPNDPWAIGFVDKTLPPTSSPRYTLKDADGNPMKFGIFGRAERISEASGYILVVARNIVMQSHYSVWYWKNNVTKLYVLYDFFNHN